MAGTQLESHDSPVVLFEGSASIAGPEPEPEPLRPEPEPEPEPQPPPAAPAPPPAPVDMTLLLRLAWMWQEKGTGREGSWARRLVHFDAHGNLCIFASETAERPEAARFDGA